MNDEDLRYELISFLGVASAVTGAPVASFVVVVKNYKGASWLLREANRRRAALGSAVAAWWWGMRA